MLDASQMETIGPECNTYTQLSLLYFNIKSCTRTNLETHLGPPHSIQF